MAARGLAQVQLGPSSCQGNDCTPGLMRAGTLFQWKVHAAEPAYAFALTKFTFVFESLPVGSQLLLLHK